MTRKLALRRRLSFHCSPTIPVLLGSHLLPPGIVDPRPGIHVHRPVCWVARTEQARRALRKSLPAMRAAQGENVVRPGQAERTVVVCQATTGRPGGVHDPDKLGQRSEGRGRVELAHPRDGPDRRNRNQRGFGCSRPGTSARRNRARSGPTGNPRMCSRRAPATSGMSCTLRRAHRQYNSSIGGGRPDDRHPQQGGTVALHRALLCGAPSPLEDLLDVLRRVHRVPSRAEGVPQGEDFPPHDGPLAGGSRPGPSGHRLSGTCTPSARSSRWNQPSVVS